MTAVLATLVVGSLVLMLQLLRLGHHLAGAPLPWSAILAIVGASLPTLALHALPLGLFVGVLFTLGAFAEERQLLGAEATGLAVGRVTARAALYLSLVFAAVAAVAAVAEPAALGRLHRSLASQATRALLLGARPKTFHAIGPRTTIYFEAARSDGPDTARLERLFLARDGVGEILLARQARLRFSPTGTEVELDLRGVEIQTKREKDGGLRRLLLGRLHERLDLSAAIAPHFGFLLDRARRDPLDGPLLVAPAHCLALALLAVAVGRLTVHRRLRGAALGAAVTAGYLLGSAVAERFAGPPAAVGWAVTTAALAALVAVRARRWPG